MKKDEQPVSLSLVLAPLSAMRVDRIERPPRGCAPTAMPALDPISQTFELFLGEPGACRAVRSIP